MSCRIVVPISSEPISGRSIQAARQLARYIGASLLLISVVREPAEIRARRNELRSIERMLLSEQPELKVQSSVVADEDIKAAILAATDSGDILVVATRATVFEGDHFVGSIAEDLIRSSGQPVLVIGPECDIDEPFKVDCVAVPLDGTAAAEGSIKEAVRWAHLLDVPLWLLSVNTPGDGPSAVEEASSRFADTARRDRQRYLQLVGHELRASDLDVEWAVLDNDDPSQALLDRAGQDALIVTTTHSRHGLDRIARPSLATDLYAHASHPTVVTSIA